MSPLAPSANTSNFESENNDPESIPVSETRSKVSYTAEDLLKLRYTMNKPLKLDENPELRLIARINLMPDFASFSFNSSQRMQQNDITNRDNFKQRNNVQKREMSTNQSENNIQFRLYPQDEVKLKTSENAWRPSVMLSRKNNSNEDDIIELSRRVRSILNKLTAQNFTVMLEEFKEIKIDTTEKLNIVINLVFEKAVNEPNFSIGYAYLCKHLSNCSTEIKSESTFFKRTLISKCQHEFEQNVANKHLMEQALMPLNEKLKKCPLNEVEQRNELKASIIEEESIIRRRLVSTVRFIGELYKLDMLTTKIMNGCIQILVDIKSEEKLECVCKLLTTIGQKLETKPTDNSESASKRYLDLSEYMKQFKRIIDGKIPKLKVSNRVRFMLMDILELRANNWKPKQQFTSAIRT